MRAPALALLLAAVLFLAGCAAPGDEAPGATLAGTGAPAALLDPLAPGPHAVAWADYDAGAATVGGPDANHSRYEYEARLRGRVWWPEAEGPRPLLVLLHGNHAPCGFAGEEFNLYVDDCSDDEGLNRAYPSHLGYAYLAEHLASHGYVVASILGYEVNDRNGAPDAGIRARAELMLATLDAFRDGAEGIPPEAVARADLSRVGLMGHSRGGEGAVAAVHANLARPEAERHALLAVAAVAPIDATQSDAPGVAFLALVPTCDGDVSALNGLHIFDRSRHLDDGKDKVQVVVHGANHAFYNTRWYDSVGLPYYPDEETPLRLSPACAVDRKLGGLRWSPEPTQREAIVHVGGFLRWQVGGETGLAPYLTGAAPFPDAACPATAPCPALVGVSAILADATRVLVVDEGVPQTHALGGPVELDGFASARACVGRACDPEMGSDAPALALSWDGPARLVLRLDGADWSQADVLTFRVAVPGWRSPASPPVDVGVALADATGPGWVARASEHSTSALLRSEEPPHAVNPRGNARLALQTVRIPLDVFAVDTADVREVTLSFDGEGSLFLTDVLVMAEPDVSA